MRKDYYSRMAIIWIPLMFLSFLSYGQESNNDTTLTDELNIDFNTKKKKHDYILPPWRARRFNASAGLFFPLNNTEVRVGATNRDLSTTIDLEDDLGFEKTTFSFMAKFQWRFSKRSRVEFEYFYLDRKSTKRLEREIDFGDEIYPINAEATAFFNFSIIRFSYSYAIINKPTYEIGVLIGSHIMLGDIGIRARVNATEAELNNSFDFVAPIPDIGLWTDIQLSPKFGVYGNINYLSLSIGDVSGKVLSTNAALLYNIHNNWNIKAGYNLLDIKVDVEKQRLEGSFEWGYNGPTLSICYTFGEQLKI
ncbi:TonB-dependent receptor [Mangrovimonas aestuarii]|uniref:hypothetical protein n=1 Tax=Mangrovimonas aestuarii TaxID=3018443 RepID=UPI0023783A24|nr:hypothetical protein [Mangrovimonas aestuarii]